MKNPAPRFSAEPSKFHDWLIGYDFNAVHHSFYGAFVRNDPVGIVGPGTKHLRSDQELNELSHSDGTTQEARDAWFSLLHVSANDTFKSVVRAECSLGAAHRAMVCHFNTTVRISIVLLVRKCSRRKIRRGENLLILEQEFLAASHLLSTTRYQFSMTILLPFS